MDTTRRASLPLRWLFVVFLAACSAPGAPAPAVPAWPVAWGTPSEPVEAALDGGVPPPPLPVAVTVGGGVSLGAYQAGFLYFLSEAVKAGKRNVAGAPLVDVVLATGASAGSINALVTLIDSCSNRPVPDPTRSVFWNVWLDVGFNALFPTNPTPGTTAPAAAFSTEALSNLAAKPLKDAWDHLPLGCDRVFVATTTRLNPLVVKDGGIKVKRAEEKFALRIRGRWEEGKPPAGPIVENYFDPEAVPSVPLLALPPASHQEARDLYPGVDQQVWDRVLDLLMASSAFPGAFPAHALRHCLSDDPDLRQVSVDAPTVCGKDEILANNPLRVDPFVDGGVFDNSPLRAASRTVRDGLRLDEGRLQWTKTPRAKPHPSCSRASPSPSCAVRFVFVDKDNAAYPDPPELFPAPADPAKPGGEARREPRDSLLSYVGQFLTTSFDSATAKELYTLIEEDPNFVDRMAISRRSLPTASGHLQNFFGFFEKSFREFDFHLGMYDAERYLQQNLDRSAGRAMGPADRSQLQQLSCIEGVLEGRAAQQNPCPQGDDPRAKAFRILLQVAVDRLYDQCRILRRNQEAQALCRAVMPHPDGPRPKVPGVDGVDTVRWQSGEDEDALPYMMRLLAAYGFTFADLDGSPVDAARAMPLIRDKLGMVITTVGARQSRGHQALVDTLGKAALNFFDYAPPLHIVYADLGRGFNIGYSKRLSRIRWFPLRLELTTQVKGFTDPPLWSGAIAQLAGLEYEIPAPLREYFVFRLHGRVGVQWSPFAQHCAQDWGVYNTVCHALVVQPGASFALFDRIRVQGSAEYLNPQVFQQNVAAKWDAVYGAGVQLLW